MSEEDKDRWDALEWDEKDGVPDRVEAAAVNKWLFNKDTVDKVLAHLMTRGLTVAGGDRLGKTILFAKNQAHAEFIAERFDINYPHLKGHFAQAITFKIEQAQTLIEQFAVKDKAPYLAISVDMLDTDIDVPEVVNLVFIQAGAFEDQVLADAGSRDAALSGLVCSRREQAVLLPVRLLS